MFGSAVVTLADDGIVRFGSKKTIASKKDIMAELERSGSVGSYCIENDGIPANTVGIDLSTARLLLKTIWPLINTKTKPKELGDTPKERIQSSLRKKPMYTKVLFYTEEKSRTCVLVLKNNGKMKGCLVENCNPSLIRFKALEGSYKKDFREEIQTWINGEKVTMEYASVSSDDLVIVDVYDNVNLDDVLCVVFTTAHFDSWD